MTALNPKDVENVAAHQIRRNMAGRLENPTIFPDVVELLKDAGTANDPASFTEFRNICLTRANMHAVTVHDAIPDIEKFIEDIWNAAKCAKRYQEMQPCW